MLYLLTIVSILFLITLYNNLKLKKKLKNHSNNNQKEIEKSYFNETYINWNTDDEIILIFTMLNNYILIPRGLSYSDYNLLKFYIKGNIKNFSKDGYIEFKNYSIQILDNENRIVSNNTMFDLYINDKKTATDRVDKIINFIRSNKSYNIFNINSKEHKLTFLKNNSYELRKVHDSFKETKEYIDIYKDISLNKYD